MGYSVTLVGRQLPNSLPLDTTYQTKRFSLWFNRGFFFYAEYSIRLFFYLISKRSELLWSNDLDTLLPNFIVSRIRSTNLIYDSHELFTEVPELSSRPLVRSFWSFLEGYMIPKLKQMITVNHKIADYYSTKYKVNVDVVRNLSVGPADLSLNERLIETSKKGQPLLILQGRGININRGAEEAVEMMRYLEGFRLLIIGGGDVFEPLKKKIQELSFSDRITILDELPYDEMLEYTKISDLGLTLDKGGSLNYEYSLPNKLFDYIQCGLPILSSERPLIKELIEEHEIGWIQPDLSPLALATKVRSIFDNQKEFEHVKNNIMNCRKEFSWQKEKEHLRTIINKRVERDSLS